MTEAPLGLYIHWPYCARICPYCDFNVYRARGDDEALFNALLADLAYWADRLPGRDLASLHFGGGTPSLLSPQRLEQIIEMAGQKFGFVVGAEIGLEANPNDSKAFASFAAAGINRLSLGVQSFDDDALRALGRDHDARAAQDAVAAVVSNFSNWSLDLIYAREGQRESGWLKELDAAIATGMPHLSLYQLTIEPGTAFARRVSRGELTPPGDETGECLYRLTQQVCRDAGLAGYEISNHARPGFESRHNRLYWEGGDWIGIGPGGHGRIGSGGSGGRLATETALRPDDYVTLVRETGTGAIESRLSSVEEAQERILMGLRIADGLDRSRLRHLTGLDINTDEASRMARQGFIVLDDDRVRLTAEGRLLADGVASALCP